MPPISAAMERSFITCSILHTGQQKKEINAEKTWQVDLGT